MHNEARTAPLAPVSFDYSPQAQRTQAEILLALIEQEMVDTPDTLYLLIDPVPLVLQPDTTFCDQLVACKPVPVSLPHKGVSMQDCPWLVSLDLSRDDGPLPTESKAKPRCRCSRSICATTPGASPSL